MDSFIGGQGQTRIQSMTAAIALGKAFFWDPRFSSDKKVACASCHFAAGTDQRTRGVVSLPANMGVRIPWPQAQGAKEGRYLPYNLSAQDLIPGSQDDGGPTTPGVFDPDSLVGYPVREVIGSQGVRLREFKGLVQDGNTWSEKLVTPSLNAENGSLKPLLEQVHHLSTTHRQVTPRNAGTVINAVFNSRNFHDSRASNVFNGHNGWGRHIDTLVNRHIYVLRDKDNNLKKTHTTTPIGEDAAYYLADAALASQAVEPLVSEVEMSANLRMLHHVARRMLDERILDGQTISPDDSSLAPYADPTKRPTYRELIEKVFRPEWHANKTAKVALPTVDVDNAIKPRVDDFIVADFDQIEFNFGLFWGLAIQLYESTLISDQSRFDTELANTKASARARLTQGPAGNPLELRQKQPLTASERRGMELFRTIGCAECHGTAALSSASIFELGLIGKNRSPFTDPLPDELPIPDLGDDDDDLVDAGNLCPPVQRFGVECMGFNDVFQSIYDGGNYNLGISRFIRPHSWPVSPAVADAGGVGEWLKKKATPQTIWEDHGNGYPWMPEDADKKEGDTPEIVMRRKFGNYLKKDTSRIAQLERMLGIQPDINRTLENISMEPWTQSARPLNRTRAPLNYTLVQEPVSQESAPSGTGITLKRGEDAGQRGLVPIRLSGSLTYIVGPGTAPPPPSLSRRWFMEMKRSLASAVANLAKAKAQVPPNQALIDVWERQVRALTGLLANQERLADVGAFRAPTLRNIELTGPYMHNGSLLTLEAVIDFYARGGDYNQRIKANTGDGKNGDQHPEMEPFHISTEQRADLVAFLKSLTDDRVRNQTAPFDRPSLDIQEDSNGADISYTPMIPAVSFEEVLISKPLRD
ncbi:MAG: hypothetical protein JNK37_12230 [Verrucomicrobiales bacterium]|nr:hypothetical protein [Verrucomicrobiales bacterium]